MLGQRLEAPLSKTGEDELDRLLETARAKYADPRIEVRREALEKLWDAWERAKSLDCPDNKKKGIQGRLDRAAGAKPRLREFLENDAQEPTEIGNQPMIRHSETDKEPIEAAEHIDYLFHRLFNMIWLVPRFPQ